MTELELEQVNNVYDILAQVRKEMDMINGLIIERDHTIRFNALCKDYNSIKSMSGLQRTSINRRIIVLQEDLRTLRKTINEWTSEG